MSESQPQLLPFSNDVFLIRNTSNNLYLTLSETRPGAPIILAERTWSRSNVKKLKVHGIVATSFFPILIRSFESGFSETKARAQMTPKWSPFSITWTTIWVFLAPRVW